MIRRNAIFLSEVVRLALDSRDERAEKFRKFLVEQVGYYGIENAEEGIQAFREENELKS